MPERIQLPGGAHGAGVLARLGEALFDRHDFGTALGIDGHAELLGGLLSDPAVGGQRAGTFSARAAEARRARRWAVRRADAVSSALWTARPTRARGRVGARRGRISTSTGCGR